MSVPPGGQHLTPDPSRADIRRERRAFVAVHHPDRGGDPAAFADGLSRFAAQLAAVAEPRARVTGVRRPRGLSGMVQRLRSRHQRRQAPPRVR